MDEQNIPQTQKSSPSSIQNQGAAHSSFFFFMLVKLSITVNQTYYMEVLKRLRDAIQRKRPELWRSGDWFFHHDNAPVHSALRTREFMAKHSITVLPHPPYSPDLVPCDFFLSPMLKRPLKGRFETILEIKANATKEFKGIKKEAYLDCICKWKHRWERCVHQEGEYFEGDPDL